MKKYLRVDLLRWDYPEQEKPSVDVWFTLASGSTKVKIHSIELNQHYLRSIPLEGITGRLGKRFYLKDGLAFLEELRFAFTGSRIRATEVYKIKNGIRPRLEFEPEEPEEPEEEVEEEDYPDFGEDEFLDGAADILKNEKKCLNCKHLYKNDYTCKAFPNGIPIVFKTCRREHLRPSKKYNQKNDLVWEFDIDQKWLGRQRKIDRETEIKVIKCGTDQDKAVRIFHKLKKEGWDVDIRSWDEWPQEFTVYASRRKPARG